MALTHTQQENKLLKDQLIQLKQENIRLREMASANERLKNFLQLKAENFRSFHSGQSGGKWSQPIFANLLY